MIRIRRSTARRTAVGVAGVSIVALGLVLMPLPGPGTLIVAGGLNLLRREYPLAGRVLDRVGRIQEKARLFKKSGSDTDSPE